MAKKQKDAQKGILGDINPTPAAHDYVRGRGDVDTEKKSPEAMEGGSQHDESRHSGSRDVTEGTTGGLSPETGGSSNFRSGSGATGTEIGYRPETKRHQP